MNKVSTACIASAAIFLAIALDPASAAPVRNAVAVKAAIGTDTIQVHWRGGRRHASWAYRCAWTPPSCPPYSFVPREGGWRPIVAWRIRPGYAFAGGYGYAWDAPDYVAPSASWYALSHPVKWFESRRVHARVHRHVRHVTATKESANDTE